MSGYATVVITLDDENDDADIAYRIYHIDADKAEQVAAFLGEAHENGIVPGSACDAIADTAEAAVIEL